MELREINLTKEHFIPNRYMDSDKNVVCSTHFFKFIIEDYDDGVLVKMKHIKDEYMLYLPRYLFGMRDDEDYFLPIRVTNTVITHDKLIELIEFYKNAFDEFNSTMEGIINELHKNI